jgi:hypothetical protein
VTWAGSRDWRGQREGEMARDRFEQHVTLRRFSISAWQRFGNTRGRKSRRNRTG